MCHHRCLAEIAARAKQVDQVTGSLPLAQQVITAGLQFAGNSALLQGLKGIAEELQAVATVSELHPTLHGASSQASEDIPFL